MTTEENSISVICCFCGDGIEYSSAVRLVMKPSPDSEESQGFYCHPKCLDNVIHKDIPRHPDLITKDSK